MGQLPFAVSPKLWVLGTWAGHAAGGTGLRLHWAGVWSCGVGTLLLGTECGGEGGGTGEAEWGAGDLGDTEVRGGQGLLQLLRRHGQASGFCAAGGRALSTEGKAHCN